MFWNKSVNEKLKPIIGGVGGGAHFGSMNLSYLSSSENFTKP